MPNVEQGAQLATPTQAREIAELVTDICRNPEFEADTGVFDHVVISSINDSQIQLATYQNPFEHEGPVDCDATTREIVDRTDSGQLILESRFSFIDLRYRRPTITAHRAYLTLEDGSERLKPISKPIIAPFGVPRRERKRLERQAKEVERLNRAARTEEFLTSDYDKLIVRLGQFSTGTVLLCGEEASAYQLGAYALWA